MALLRRVTNAVTNTVTNASSEQCVTNAAHATPRHATKQEPSRFERSRSASFVVEDPSSRAPRHTAPRPFPPVFLRIVSATLRSERFETYADLVDAVKTACARARVRYDSPTVWAAVRTVALHRGGILATGKAQRVQLTPDDRPMSRRQVAECLTRLAKEGLAVEVSTWR